MLDTCDSPHGALNKARSDFLPEQTTYANEDNSNNNPPSQITSPPDSPMDIDMSIPFDFAMNNMEHISSLEQAICSNFTCCSIQLPDLHALVEHFEEKHVVVFNLDGMRIYPENSGRRLAHFPPPPSLSHSPSSSRSSSVVSSPQTPTTPLLQSEMATAAAATTRKPRASTSPCPQVYTPFNISRIPEAEYGLGPLDLDEIGPDPYPIISCPLYDIYPPSPESLKSSSRSQQQQQQGPVPLDSVAIDPAASGPSCSGGGDKPTSFERERRVRTKADIVNATAVSAKNPLKAKARITGGNGKRREKAYRCPTPGCTKSYLNPNGLKYHVEKGTCRFEDSTDSEVPLTTTENSRGTPPPLHANASATAAVAAPAPPLPSTTSPASTPSPSPSPGSSASSSELVTKNEPLLLGGNNPSSHFLTSRISGTTTTGGGSNSPHLLLPHSSPSSPMMTGYTLTRPLNTIPC